MIVYQKPLNRKPDNPIEDYHARRFEVWLFLKNHKHIIYHTVLYSKKQVRTNYIATGNRVSSQNVFD
jgi:hypothetical protein